MNKKFLISLLVILLLVGGAVATGILFDFPYSPESPPRAKETGSTQEGIGEVSSAMNRFSLDLYHRLSEREEGNIFYSPYSIFSALTMTYEGARGQTAGEMESVFYLPEKDVLRPNFGAIYNTINEPSEEYKLGTGNALWAQKDYPFREEYIKTVEDFYGGKATNLDFAEETEKSRQTINTFIEKQTNGKIKELLAKGDIGPMTRMVLTNAIYFKGTWSVEFDKENTENREFHITPDKTVEVPMMQMSPEEEMFNYTETGKLQMLELPYKGKDLSMFVLLPNESLEDIKANLTAENLNEWTRNMRETDLKTIQMPKFEFDTKYKKMKRTLSDMGMPTAFTGQADFSGMDGTQRLFIDKVIHQAFVSVDEEGTEAAAATAVTMKATAMIDQSPSFIANKPFIFLIRENETGSILFLGRVTDPTE